MTEYFGVIAASSSGSTACMDLISGREHTAERVSELIGSGHKVRVFKCTEVEYEIHTAVAIEIKS